MPRLYRIFGKQEESKTELTTPGSIITKIINDWKRGGAANMAEIYITTETSTVAARVFKQGKNLDVIVQNVTQLALDAVNRIINVAPATAFVDFVLGRGRRRRSGHDGEIRVADEIRGLEVDIDAA